MPSYRRMFRIELLMICLVPLCSSMELFAQSAAPFPVELVAFEREPLEPVFMAGESGAWDARLRERGWILKEKDGWKMWYTGYKGAREDEKKLGLATSADGVTWTRHPANPIVSDRWVEDVMVWPHDGVYFMAAEGTNDQAHLMTSTDGVHWKPEGTFDVRRVDGAPITPGPFGTPTLWVEDGVWNLFYERGDLGIWRATSTDRKVWTNVSDEPVIGLGPKQYDAAAVALNQ
ncbi:MAG: glycosylase, partial [Planctomycetia bacterium]